MTIQAGQLKRKVTIEQPVMTQTATGEEVPTWEPIGDFWARIEPLSGREALLANVNISEMDTRILIRWSLALVAITTGWRVLHKNKIYDIKSALSPELANREIEMLAKSGVTEG